MQISSLAFQKDPSNQHLLKPKKNLVAKKTTHATSPKVPQRNSRRRKKFEQFKEFASEH